MKRLKKTTKPVDPFDELLAKNELLAKLAKQWGERLKSKPTDYSDTEVLPKGVNRTQRIIFEL